MENAIKDLGKILVDTYLKDNGFPDSISKLTVRSKLNNGLNDIVQKHHLNPNPRGERIRHIISEGVTGALMFAGYSYDQQAKMYHRNSSVDDNY